MKTTKKSTSKILSQIARGTIVCGLTACIALPAMAQSAAQFGSAYPSRASEAIETPNLSARIQPKIDIKEAEIMKAPAGAEKISFTLKKLDVSGMTVYNQDDIKGLYSKDLGKTITLADLYGIAGDLTRKYRNAGYILTQVIIPPQTIEGGTAKLQVVEGYIDTISVRDTEPDKATKLVRQLAAQVKGQKTPLNVADLERSLLLINDLPGVKARSVLSPSPTKTGSADLTIILDRTLYDGMVSFDNYGTRYLGPGQFGGAFSLNSYFDMNEKITAQIYLAPEIFRGFELNYFSLGYSMPISDDGTSVNLFASRTGTDPGYTLRQFGVQGHSQYASVELDHPYIRSRDRNLTGRVKFDWRDVTSKNNIGADPTRTDHIRAFRVGGRYDFLDRMFGAGYNVADIELSQGLDAFGASQKNLNTLSRPAGNPYFTKLNVEVQRLQRLNSSFNFLLAAKGQWSGSALLTSEEFGIGGQSYGRGYDPSEIVGDSGYAAKAELQYYRPINVPYFSNYYMYTFFDGGSVWNHDPATSANGRDSLSSTGLGLHATMDSGIKMDFMVAKPLTAKVQTMDNRGLRAFMSISKEF